MAASNTHNNTPQSIAVVGGGVIGLSVAWRLARAGRKVTVYERGKTGRAASWVAGGMLAPIAEYGFEDDTFFELGQHSLARYPSYLEELHDDAGTRVALDTRGAMMVGLDRDDAEAIRRLYRFRDNRGLAVGWLTGSEAREQEPLLSPRVSAGMWIPDDFEVDNRALVTALAKAVVARGGTVFEDATVERIVESGGRANGIVARGERIDADAVVLCAGSWSAGIDGAPQLPVRPIKGQIVSLVRDHNCELGHVIRTPDIYLIPKADGRLIVGATQEEMGFDDSPTAGGVMRLLEDAWETVPSIYDLAIASIDVGLRPGSRDHLPMVGPTEVDGLWAATGHFRHGILLAPVTADAIAAGITGSDTGVDMAPFSPLRFATTAG